MDFTNAQQGSFFIFLLWNQLKIFRALRTGYKVGSRCRLRCRRGYKPVEGSSIRKICQSDAKWTGNHGSCEKVKCPHLTAPNNGHVTCSGQDIGATCDISCEEGFSLEGGNKAECNDKGDWKFSSAESVMSSSPSCRKIDYPPPFIICPPDVVKPLPSGSASVYVMFPQPKTNVDWFR